MIELNSFVLSIGAKEVSAKEFESLVQLYGKGTQGITKEGFVAWKYTDSQKDPAPLCLMFSRLGYEPCGQLSMSTSANTESGLSWQDWTYEMDETLVAFVNYIWEKTGVDSLSLSHGMIWLSEQEKKTTYPSLKNVSLKDLRHRFSILKKLNQLVQSSLTLIDLTRFHQPYSLAGRLDSIRSLLFYSTKLSFLREVLKLTSTQLNPPTIYLSRINGNQKIFTFKKKGKKKL